MSSDVNRQYQEHLLGNEWPRNQGVTLSRNILMLKSFHGRARPLIWSDISMTIVIDVLNTVYDLLNIFFKIIFKCYATLVYRYELDNM